MKISVKVHFDVNRNVDCAVDNHRVLASEFAPSFPLRSALLRWSAKVAHVKDAEVFGVYFHGDRTTFLVKLKNDAFGRFGTEGRSTVRSEFSLPIGISKIQLFLVEFDPHSVPSATVHSFKLLQ